MKARFTSNRASFYRKNAAFIDMVQGHMAQDIEIAVKTTSGIPVSATIAGRKSRGQSNGRGGGHMRSEVRHFRNATGGFRVEIDKAYAAYQERGMRADGTHIVRHYSTPGTSKGFFRRGINSVLRHRETYIKEAKQAVGL